MASISDAGSAIDNTSQVQDDYQSAAAAMTDAFSDTDYEDTNAEIPITEMAGNDPELLAILNGYDKDGDGHISRDEYNRAMTDLQHKTDTLTSIMGMVAETAAKISEALTAVAKYF